MWYFKVGWTILALTFLTYLCQGLNTGAQMRGIIKYPINGMLTQYLPSFEETSAPRNNRMTADYPPCKFNTECICSNTGPDLGLVFCDNVELGRVPKDLNNTKIHTLTLKNNQLKYIDDFSFYGTGIYRLEIQYNLLLDIPEGALWGVERSIWQLDLRYNKLSRVPTNAIKKLRKLTHLDLTGNYISDLSFNDFLGLERSLKTLVLAKNSLVNLPESFLKTFQRLENLDLSGNNIYSIHDRAFMGSPGRLNHIKLADNLLLQIPFEALSEVHNLQTLNLAGNRITSTFKVLFRGFLSLDTLILDFNEIEKLPPYSFQNFGSINRTSLRGNPLNDIYNDAFKDTKIRELYLHDCELRTFSETAFRGLESSLQLLDLSFNNISSVPEKLFDNLDAVKSLSISYNKLSIDPNTSFNGFKYKLQYLNLLGEDMGEFPVKSLKEIRNVRTLGLSTLPGTILAKEHFTGFGPAVEKLYLFHNGITSIANHAFEFVPGVKVLDLSHNSIRTMGKEAFANIGGGLENLRISSGLEMRSLPTEPMVYLGNLKQLDLSNNQLDYLDADSIHYLRNLKKLNLRDNKIKRLDEHLFQGKFHPYLESIQISFNSLSEIKSMTFHDNRMLSHIYLEDNMINRVNHYAFSNLENLEYLYLQGNNIQQLSFEAFQNMPKLKLLDLSFNEMTNLNLDAFEQVGTLSTLTINAGNNRISNLKINGTMWNSYSGIKIIHFTRNNISMISKNYFESLRSSLYQLKFDYNNLRNISGSIFHHMPHLKLLNFCHNHIDFIDPFVFKGTLSLQYVSFCHNHLIELPRNLFTGQEKMRYIDISFNIIRRISDDLFDDAPLEIFRASHNRIRSFPDTALQKSSDSLRVVDLSYNEISDLTDAVLGRFNNLVSLDLSHNRIKTVESRSFHNLWRLAFLDISNNPVKNMERYALNGLHNTLHNLSLANTTLVSIPEIEFPNLVELNISNNEITFLPAITLANLTSLRALDVSGNKLRSASSNAWQKMPRLRWLSIKENPIMSITNDSFLGLERLENLEVSKLPLQSFLTGAFSSLQSLKVLSITTQPMLQLINLASAISNVPSLEKLNLEVDGTLDYQLQSSYLPKRLSNITFTGKNFKQISNYALQTVTSRELRLTFYKTGLISIPSEFFRNLGKVRFLALATVNNSLQTMGRPSTTSNPGEPGSVFLTDLRVDGNKWKCDCGIGWMEYWMKEVHVASCERDSPIQSARCSEPFWSLRRSKCADRGGKTLMEAFKKDLECGSTSGATSTGFIINWTLLLISCWWIICVC